MNQYLYPIFQTSGKNGCSDLTIALAMFLSDARLGKQQYGPDGVDYEQLHADYEQLMEQEREKTNGRYLSRRYRGTRFRKYLSVLVLLVWDGLLLYMIVDCLIEPVYGAAFVAVVSVYLGYQI